jgi:cobalt-zinc-cadmium efflux system protein
MGHDHHHHHHHGHGDSSRNIAIAFFLNLSFALIEVAGGLWTNSIAILSDALHDFGDSISIGVAWYLQRVAQRGRDQTFNYGYRRFSTLGALVTGFVLSVGLVFVLWHAVARLLNPEPVHAQGMMLIAIVGILFNGAAVLRLRKGSSLNESVLTWHMIEDVLGWVAVLLGSLAMSVWDVPILDPILSIGISAFILWNVVRSLRKVFMVFMQSSPGIFNAADFERQVLKIPKVVSSHNTQTWSLDGEHHVLTSHLVVRADASREDVVSAKRQVHALLKSHHFEHITLDIEVEGDACVSGLPGS